MLSARLLRLPLLAGALAILAQAAQAGPFQGVDHYLKVSGIVNAAQGQCEVRADVSRLLAYGRELDIEGAPSPELELRMLDIMASSLNETGARIASEGRDAVCAELLGLYGPQGSEVPGLLLRRAD